MPKLCSPGSTGVGMVAGAMVRQVMLGAVMRVLAIWVAVMLGAGMLQMLRAVLQVLAI